MARSNTKIVILTRVAKFARKNFPWYTDKDLEEELRAYVQSVPMTDVTDEDIRIALEDSRR